MDQADAKNLQKSSSKIERKLEVKVDQLSRSMYLVIGWLNGGRRSRTGEEDLKTCQKVTSKTGPFQVQKWHVKSCLDDKHSRRKCYCFRRSKSESSSSKVDHFGWGQPFQKETELKTSLRYLCLYQTSKTRLTRYLKCNTKLDSGKAGLGNTGVIKWSTFGSEQSWRLPCFWTIRPVKSQTTFNHNNNEQRLNQHQSRDCCIKRIQSKVILVLRRVSLCFDCISFRSSSSCYWFVFVRCCCG